MTLPAEAGDSGSNTENTLTEAAQASENLLETPEWHVYLIRARCSSLYCGVTTDVSRRFAEHQSNGTKTARFLRGKQPLQLAWHRKVGDKRHAMRLEYKIKRLGKATKERLCNDDRLWQVLLIETK